MGNAITEWVEALLNIVYPRGIKCLLCDNELFYKEDYSLCEYCFSQVHFVENQGCKKCGRFVGLHDVSMLCGDCKGARKPFHSVYSVALYDDLTRRLILDLKFKNGRYAAYHMGGLMYERIQSVAGLEEWVDMIIPVPLHPKRWNKRGYNQSELLASRLSELMDKPVLNHVVKRVVNTASQATLDRAQRLKNLQGAFLVAEESVILGKNILVVDDVFTTGSTLEAVSYELVLKGAHEIKGLTFATAFGNNHKDS